jgi:dipeptidase E
MKRLLLASSGIGALRELVGDPAGLRFAFVPTAAGPEPESRPWVQADRGQLRSLGCEVSTLELATAGPAEVSAALSSVDGVFLTGGNAYLLLRHALRSGFAELVVPLVESGELLYAGTSAGAILAGPDLEPAASQDDRAAVPELGSSRALGLVGFSILPHDQDPDCAEHHDAVVSAVASGDFIRLTDDRAVLVHGDTWQVVESPHL